MNYSEEHLAPLKERGLALMQSNRIKEAKALFEHVCKFNPEDAEVWYALSSINGMLGNIDEAGNCCRQVIALRPGHSQAHLNLGNVLFCQGNLDEALSEYKYAMRINPNDPGAQTNLGNLLKTIGRIDEAAACFQEALRLDPNIAEAHNNLGNIFLFNKNRLDESLPCYLEALRLKPDLVQAHINLGNVYMLQGKLDQALSSYQEALRHEPHNALAHSNLLFMLCYRSDYDAAALFAEHVRWGKIHGRDPAGITAHRNVPDKGKRLRIGYVSADFRNHPVGIFIEQVLAHNDKTQFEIFCYSNHAVRDDLTVRLRGHAAHWRDIVGQTDESVARRIREDGIDILVDLSGHTSGNRLLTFAQKPAPIQVTWMSYIATTGLKAVDYIIGDRFVIPPQDERFYVEQVVRLPNSYLCFTPPRFPIEVSPLPALARKAVTFGCFNNTAKLTPEVIAAWAQLLLAVPRSRLFLKSTGFGDETVRRHYRRLFGRHGVEAERIEFSGRSPRNELLAAYHEVDIGLDPFPYNGGTTTVEALWMGVPVISLRGDRFVSRVGDSVLSTAGMGEYVADNQDAYIAKAMALASDLPRLAGLRRRLREQLLNSPLCDGQGFTRDLEAAYRTMWKSWCHTQQEPQVL